MPADRDGFGRDELGEVLSHYDVGVIRSAKEFGRGSRRAPKLLLETPSGRYLLKRRASGRDDPFKVAFAHALMGHLRAKQFPVPALIGTCDEQNTMLQLRGHVYEMFEYVEGERYDSSLEQTSRAGQTLSAYHDAVVDFVTQWRPPAGSYHDAPNVRAALNAIPTVASEHPRVRECGHPARGRDARTRQRQPFAAQDAGGPGRPITGAALLQLTQMLHGKYDQLAETVNRAGFGNWAPVIIHGDWHPGNLLFREGKVCAVLDFDAARYQPPIVDIAYGMLQFSILRAESSPDQWPDFFDEARMRRFLAGYCGGECGHPARGRDARTPRRQPFAAQDAAGPGRPITGAAPLPPSSGERTVIPSLMMEALIAEAVLPIAVTGSFGSLPGFGVLQMVARKVRWLEDNSERVHRWLTE